MLNFVDCLNPVKGTPKIRDDYDVDERKKEAFQRLLLSFCRPSLAASLRLLFHARFVSPLCS